MDRKTVTTLIDELYIRSLEAGEVLEAHPESLDEISRLEARIADLWQDLARALDDSPQPV
ncbi:MAG: hypothetical protein IPM37_13475 [Hahellaceae bacterium]|nr:hypothetical protein [Hahellaceae bacterium]